ncbi:hypothetical protein EDD15DRAFT_2191043 [Pisolithus albus]|nr:hypothetical protein EDD15DRAFT_2191043 [Pisolithus albus]
MAAIDNFLSLQLRVWSSSAWIVHIYEEWMSGNHAWSLQDQIPNGATLLGVVLSSDKTNISVMTGNRMAHPLLLSLANIDANIRIPRPRQYRPWYTRNLETLSPIPPRTAGRTLDDIERACIEADLNDFEEFLKAAKCYSLSGVHKPFWRDWPLSNPSKFLTPEVLHHFHCLFWDHDLQWCSIVLRPAEINYCFSLIQTPVGYHCRERVLPTMCLDEFWLILFPYSLTLPGKLQSPWVELTPFFHSGRPHAKPQASHLPSLHCSFGEGVSKLKQVTGRDHHAVQRYIVGVIVGAVPPKFLLSINALLSFCYLAQMPHFDHDALARVEMALKTFHDNKAAIISSGGRQGSNGPLQHWEIPSRESGEDDEDQEDEHEPDFEALHVTHYYTLSHTSVNYFESAEVLASGAVPNAVLPHRIFATSMTAFRLAVKPSLHVTIDEAVETFGLSDLQPAITEYVRRDDRLMTEVLNPSAEKVQIWFKFRVQQPSYHDQSLLESPQSLLASPPSVYLPGGRYDFAVISQVDESDWPSNGLRGHAIAQLRLIFCLYRSNTFLTYIQCFNATFPSSSSYTTDAAAGMHVLKCTIQSDSARVGKSLSLLLLVIDSYFQKCICDSITGLTSTMDISRPPMHVQYAVTQNSPLKLKTTSVPTTGKFFRAQDVNKDLLVELQGATINEQLLKTRSHYILDHCEKMLPAITKHIPQADANSPLSISSLQNGDEFLYRNGCWEPTDLPQILRLSESPSTTSSQPRWNRPRREAVQRRIPRTSQEEAVEGTFLPTASSEEWQVAKWLNKLALAVWAFIPGSPSTVVLGSTDSLGRAFGPQPELSWKDVISFMELTSGTYSLSNDIRTVHNAVMCKAYTVFASQPGRRFLFALPIAGQKFRAHMFDRSGVIHSCPYDIHRCPHVLLCMLAMLMLGDPKHIGYDLTLIYFPSIPQQISSRNTSPSTIQVASTMYNIVDQIFFSFLICGQTTSCWHVRLNNEHYVVKDSWTCVNRVSHEEDILRKIQDLKGVLQLVAAWTVEIGGSDDRTHLCRKSIFPLDDVRIHCRLVMRLVATPLSNFNSIRELLSVRCP